MDDFVANDGRGHERSDFRRPMEVFKVKSQSELQEVVEKVKKRMLELDAERKKQTIIKNGAVSPLGRSGEIFME